MDSTFEVHNFCLFCYRNYSPTNSEGLQNDLRLFIKLLERFLFKENDLRTRLSQLNELHDSVMGCCADCYLFVDGFCDMFHQFKCLELQLEWKVDKLLSVIKLANRVPSRVSQVQKVLQDNVNKEDSQDITYTGKYKLIKSFRHQITKHCRDRLARSRPRVSLQKIDQPCGISNCEPNEAPIKGMTRQKCSLKNDQRHYTKLEPSSSLNDDITSEDGHISNHCASDLSTPQENINEDILQHEDIPLEDEHYFEELSNGNEEDEDNTYPPVSDTVKPKETLKNHTSFENLEASMPSLSIENIILKTLSTNETTENIVKTELGHSNVEHRNIIQNSDNFDDSFTNVSSEERQPKEIEENSNRKFIEQTEMENCDTSFKKVTIATTSTFTQQRYSLREKRAPKLEQLTNAISDQEDDDLSDRDFSSPPPENSFGDTDQSLSLARKRACKTSHLKNQIERLKKRQRAKTPNVGKFKCHFCSLVKTNLVLLSLHEYKTHSTPENLLKDKGSNNKYYKKHSWSCPRCPNKSFVTSNLYIAHFSYTHFGIGSEPSESSPETSLPLPYFYGHRKNKIEEIKSELINGLMQFRCKFCKLPFTVKGELRRHIRELHQSNPKCPTTNVIETESTEKNTENFTCNFCSFTWKYAPDLALHETEHAVPKPPSKQNALKTSKCPRCPFLYTLQATYIKHHLKTHLNLLSGDYPGACKLCSGPDNYVPNREQHFNKFHNTALQEDPTKVFECEYGQCAAYFLKASQLFQHTNFIHLKNNHRCDICDKVFMSRRTLIGHKKIIHKNYDEDPSLPLACDKDGCPKRFKCEGELELHKIFHANTDRCKAKSKKDDEDEHDELVCSECGKVCKSSEALTIHQKRVHQPRNFVCQKCGKAFKSIYNLNTHMEYHKGPEGWKWECKECGKRCPDKYKLKSHLNTHSKEKPWICQFCGERYAHRHNWRNHLKMKHGNEEGAQEDIKGKFLSEGANLKRKGSKKGDCIIAGVVAEETG